MDTSELRPAKELAAKRASKFTNESPDYAEARTALLAEEIEVRRHLTGREDVRVFYNGEMPTEAADPGQDPRGAVDIAPLWNILDMTPAGRGTDWYPKLYY
ncbi:DUF899 family protein [Rhizobium sp. BR 362]